MAPFARTRRLIAELRGTASTPDREDALAGLRVREIAGSLVSREIVGDDVDANATVLEIFRDETWTRGERGDAVSRLGENAADVVWVARDVYPRVRGTAERVRLLDAASRAARRIVVLHVPVGDEGSHVGRAVIDLPRRLFRAVGLPAAEPGDRFGPDHFGHYFFDEEALRDELGRAGLEVVRRRGFLFVLRARAPGAHAISERADPFTIEIARALHAVREAERARLRETPERALTAMRARGSSAKARGPIGRARLQRAIGWVDALSPTGPSCYRRTLLELALDAGAAREPVVFGLDVGRTGHIAFKDREEKTFDVAFEVDPDDAGA